MGKTSQAKGKWLTGSQRAAKGKGKSHARWRVISLAQNREWRRSKAGSLAYEEGKEEAI